MFNVSDLWWQFKAEIIVLNRRGMNMSEQTLALIGATGRAGNQVVKEALERGYTLRILARNPDKVMKHDKITVIKGDALSKKSLNELLAGADAIVSTLGPAGINQSLKLAKESAKQWLCVNSTKLLLPIMEKHNIKRVLFTGGASLKTSQDKNSWFMRLLLNKVAPKILGEMCDDRQKEYQLLLDSNVDWTIARCGGITEDAGQNCLKTSIFKFQGGKVHPRQIAKFLIDNVNKSQYSKQAVYIASN